MFLIHGRSFLLLDMIFFVAFVVGGAEMFLIDFLSVWQLGHPWDTLCQPDPSFEQSEHHSSVDVFKMFLIDFFSI